MAHIPIFNQPDQPGAYDALSGASLVRVAASEQQEPDAIWRCPVCGQPYTSGAQPLFGSQIDAQPASEASQATTSGAHVVFRCVRCGTYSVGTLANENDKAGD